MTNRKLRIALYLVLITGVCSQTFAAEFVYAHSPSQAIQKQNINVSVQLSLHGEPLGEIKATVLEGSAFSYSVLKHKEWIGSSTGTETGFEMALKPSITNDGLIQYTLKVRQRNLLRIQNSRGAVDVPPTVEDDSIELTSVIKPGIPVDIPFGFDADTKTSKYVLKLTAGPDLENL
ncbi:hypothetical protein ACLIN3_27240 (plasmid) [Pseudomonas orientalis]|uniref:hypothetical protein n=1 Tax=Pseudomonas orientalis TaxID=76758 RepID=UPI0039872F66